MGAKPLVSVCIPTVGRTDYLGHTLQSVLQQTYTPVEVLVLDNASAPPAQALIAEFVSQHRDARVLRVDERVPMFANFNRGLRAATGKYVAFFHDDDEYHPQFVERYVTLLEANPQAVFAGGNFSIMDQARTPTRQHRRVPETGYWSGRRFIEDLISRGACALPTPGLLFRREEFLTEGFDEALPINWGDFTVLMRLAERGDVAVSREVYFTWRLHGGNDSNMPHSTAIPRRTKVLRAYLEEYVARHPADVTFVKELLSRVERNHRLGLLWGWLAATDPADAEACRMLLRECLRRPGTTSLLRLLEKLGLSLARRRAAALALRNLRQSVAS